MHSKTESISGLKLTFEHRDEPDSDKHRFVFSFIVPRDMMEGALRPKLLRQLAPSGAFEMLLMFWRGIQEEIRGKNKFASQ